MITFETQNNEPISSNPENTQQRIAGYGIFIQNDSVLMVKTHSNKWELPGGTPEAGESLRDAVQREIVEEAGMQSKVRDLVFVRESFYLSPSKKKYHSVQMYFMADISPGSLNSAAESHDISFIKMADISLTNTNRSSYEALQDLSRIRYEII